jgi:hypothetical protein
MRGSRVGSGPEGVWDGSPTAALASLTAGDEFWQGRTLHLTGAAGTLETGTPVTTTTPPVCALGGCPGLNPAGQRPAARNLGLAFDLPAVPSVLARGGQREVQSWGAEVAEKFPGRGCAGDFRRPPWRPPQWGDVGGHLGLSQTRGWGLGDSSLYFPLPASLTAPPIPSPRVTWTAPFGLKMSRWFCVVGGLRG